MVVATCLISWIRRLETLVPLGVPGRVMVRKLNQLGWVTTIVKRLTVELGALREEMELICLLGQLIVSGFLSDVLKPMQQTIIKHKY